MSSKKGRGSSKGGDYEVGFGRPPAANQFKPGQSGNPYGRRPKSKPIEDVVAPAASVAGRTAVEQVIHNELHRKVVAQENGEPITLTVLEAAVRSLGLAAMKGRVQAQRAVLEIGRNAQVAEDQRRDFMQRLVKHYKGKGNYELMKEKFERENPGAYCPLPHPDDVFYNEELGVMDFAGPFTEASWKVTLAEEYNRNQILIAMSDMLLPECSPILNSEIRDFAAGLYNAASLITRELPARFQADFERLTPEGWVQRPCDTHVDLIYFGVLGPLPPGFLKKLEAEPMAFDFFGWAMDRLSPPTKRVGLNRTRHCISAYGVKIDANQRAVALSAISGSQKRATLIRKLSTLGRKDYLPAHLVCNARRAGAELKIGRDAGKVLTDFRQSLDV